MSTNLKFIIVISIGAHGKVKVDATKDHIVTYYYPVIVLNLGPEDSKFVADTCLVNNGWVCQ